MGVLGTVSSVPSACTVIVLWPHDKTALPVFSKAVSVSVVVWVGALWEGIALGVTMAEGFSLSVVV